MIRFLLLISLIPQLVSAWGENQEYLFQFDGVNDLAQSSTNLGLSGDPEFTIIMSLYQMGTSWGSSYYTPFCNNVAGPAGTALATTFQHGKPALDFWDLRYQATSSLDLQTIYRVAFTKTPGAINATSKIYVNGVEVAGTGNSFNSPNITDGILEIGSCSYLPRWYGFVWDVKVYDVALSSAQILADYNDTHISTNLIRWYKIDDNSGTLVDSSPTADDATLLLYLQRDWLPIADFYKDMTTGSGTIVIPHGSVN